MSIYNILDTPPASGGAPVNVLAQYPEPTSDTWVSTLATPVSISTNTDTTLFTVPANKKAFLSNGSIQAFNTAGAGSGSLRPWIQFGGAGTKYPINSLSILGSGVGQNSLGPLGNLVASAGDVIGVTSTSIAGGATYEVHAVYLLVPSTDALTSYFIKDPVSGDNTMTAVPNGKTWSAISNGIITTGIVIQHENATAGALTTFEKLNGLQIQAGTSRAGNGGGAGANSPILCTLAPSDVYVSNWGGANTGGLDWIAVLER